MPRKRVPKAKTEVAAASMFSFLPTIFEVAEKTPSPPPVDYEIKDGSPLIESRRKVLISALK